MLHLPTLAPSQQRIALLLLCIYTFIGVCSLVTLTHPRLRRPEARRLRQAINTWWIPSLYCGVMALSGGTLALLLVLLLSAGTLREYLRLLPAADRHPVLDGMAYAGVALHYAALASLGPGAAARLTLLWAAFALPLCRAALLGPDGWLAASARLLYGQVLTVLSLSYVALLFTDPRPLLPAGVAGLGALLLLSIMTSDAGQFLAGKLFGRRRLAPRISPNKTREGLYGGALITAAVAAAAGPLLTPLSRPVAALLGAGLCGLGLLGDLLISALKRDSGVKDSGAVLPGQGGLLDRCDSLLLAAPVYYHVVVPLLARGT